MSTIVRHSNTCIIKLAKSSKTLEAVVDQFVPEVTLDVILDKSVKLKLKWNGKCYEGRTAGIDIESTGPSVTYTQTGARG